MRQLFEKMRREGIMSPSGEIMAGECSFIRSMGTELTGSFKKTLSYETSMEDKQKSWWYSLFSSITG